MSEPLSEQEIRGQILTMRSTGAKVFISSSFQTHSIPLLHIISTIDRQIPVVFLNTGYLFPETISFRDQVLERLGLQLIELRSSIPKLQQRDQQGNLYFTSDPDRCCFMNKIEPMIPILTEYDVWISGVRADQSDVRASMSIVEDTQYNCRKFHPLLGWSHGMIYKYRKKHELPEHPLDQDGYRSIGCEPCTRRYDPADPRSERWFGLNKTECGLHTILGTEKK